jgi:hypothetical protein
VIIDNLWRTWGAFNIPGVAQMIRQAEGWPVVFEAGQIRVYRNPAR